MLLDPRTGGIRARWVDRDGPPGRIHDKVHVFHRHGAEQHLVSQYQGSDLAEPLAEAHLDRAYIGHIARPAVRDGNLPDRLLVELQL